MLFLTSFVLSLRAVLITKLVISDIDIYRWYIYFNNISFNKSTGTSAYLSTSNLSTLLHVLVKSVGTFFNLSKSNLFKSDFRLSKSVFLAKFGVSTPFVFLNFLLLHN